MFVRKWLKILCAFLGFMLIAGCSPESYFSPASKPSATPSSVYGNASLSLNRTNANSMVKVDTNFIGLSFELSQICEVIGLDEQNPAYYEQLYLNLGSGIVHIGGHSADFGVWLPDGSTYCSATYTAVTRGMINSFFAFVARIHWQVIWGLNLIENNPQSAASEASYIASVAGSRLLAFNIGNEPDIYAKHGFRPANWGYPDYRSEWNTYYTAIRQLVPAAKFIGSDACCESSFFYNFTSDESQKIIAAAHHYYTNEDFYGTDQAESIPFLLSDRVSEIQAEYIGKWVETARQAGVPLEITESNTFSGGGKLGVSNTYASALWVIDYLSEAASLGVKRVELQNSSRASYNVIDDNGDPTPLYYGLLFFHMLVQSPGSTIESVGMQTTLDMTTYKVVDADGTVHVVLINKDLKQNASTEIQLGIPSTKAQLLRLTAPSIDATDNISLAGRGLSAQGTWSSPSNLETIPVKKNIADITVPPGSVVEVIFV
jgi:hypothetical protein